MIGGLTDECICSGKCPCKWVSTCALGAACQDGMRCGHLASFLFSIVYDVCSCSVFVGGMEEDAGARQRRLIGAAHQPRYGGGLAPTLVLTGGGKEAGEAFGKMEGPCCFGGWSEVCCAFSFFVSMVDSPSKTGDLAMISKRDAETVSADAFSEMYTIRFDQHAQLTAAQKMTIVAGQLLADYSFFAGNADKCAPQAGRGCTVCRCCYVGCLGAVCPFYFCWPSCPT